MERTSKSSVKVYILRSNRRSVAGQVLPDGSLEVRAPLSMTTEKVNKWLDKIEHKFLPIVTKYRKMNDYIADHPFGYGGEVLFMGEWMPVKKAEDDNGGYLARHENNEVVIKPNLSEDDMRYQIADLFSTLAKPILEERLHHYSELMGVSYRKWTIGNARKRHGSCDSNGKIIFSWRILMMSEPVIEYIIVHELAHLKHMNHAKEFHEEVAMVLPDWKARQKEYGEYSLMLSCSGWI